MPSKRLTDCEPALMDSFVTIRELYEAANPGHKLVVDCTHRPAEEQMLLFKIGRMELGGKWIVDDNPTTYIVTQLDGEAKKSNHNFLPSRALDFHIEIAGKPVWDVKAYVPVGDLAQKSGLRWGGTWGAQATWEEIAKRIAAKKFIDAPHLELP